VVHLQWALGRADPEFMIAVPVVASRSCWR